ncbi:hypothetical protein Lmor_1728 [Legionella moravica]|uniref:Transmembrane protein n=1 Tax=Legionella moravica TaxID=39962 RepID=A0A378K371_9GAMM|nr:DUF4381 domain-containing protein [Legionella moravica]KTD34331.1 hypothetical protein Lmor_1728 [Legionella moravica]STX64048.1 Uncharacterised protein [Legionella moravica]
MAKTDPLAQLKDIHLPDPIGWWPLAPGWYVVMSMMFLLIIGIAYWSYKQHINGLAKRKALGLLHIYKENYLKDRNVQIASARISELLRRVALVYFPRAEVASIHGDDWIDFLNKTSKNIDFKQVKAMLLESPFKTAESVNLDPLFTCAEQWIKQRGAPCLNS